MATEVKKNRGRSLQRLLVGLAVAMLVGLFPARAEADPADPIDCGDTLSGDETYVLTADVGPCPGLGPAIIVEGPATLKLNGWSVICDHVITLVPDADDGVLTAVVTFGILDSVGIVLTGTGAELRGAGSYTEGANPEPKNSVMGCGHNVIVEGEGKHEVTGVTSVVALSGAFVVTSNENELTGNVIHQYFAEPDPVRPVKSAGTGFTIEGHVNGLYKNVAADSMEHGFQLDGNENHMEDNVARDNEEYGVVVEGHGNRISSNSSAKNIGGGFLVGEEAEENRLSHNTSSENGDGDPANGFEIHGSNNLLNANTADHNGQFGIILTATAQGNIITKNAVSRSGQNVPFSEEIDLVDETACGSNTWYRNIFGTRSPDCIR